MTLYVVSQMTFKRSYRSTTGASILPENNCVAVYIDRTKPPSKVQIHRMRHTHVVRTPAKELGIKSIEIEFAGDGKAFCDKMNRVEQDLLARYF